MQFTELFLNPSGGTTAERRKARPKKKEIRKRRKEKADWALEEEEEGEEVEKEVVERSWRQPWRQLFCPGGAPPRFLYVSLPGSPVPISPPIHRLRPFSLLQYLYTYTRFIYIARTGRNALTVCIFLLRSRK